MTMDIAAKRWLSEVRVAARMQHHNIVRLYQVEETPDWFLLSLNTFREANFVTG